MSKTFMTVKLFEPHGNGSKHKYTKIKGNMDAVLLKLGVEADDFQKMLTNKKRK